LFASDADRIRRAITELVALAPDVILANGTSIVAPLLRETRTLPIVFVSVTDPVGGGFVASLARPGGNATGFTALEYGMSGKYLELLKQIAPRLSRAAVLREPSIASGSGQFGAIQAVAPLLMLWTAPPPARERHGSGVLLELPRFGGANHASDHDNRSRYREVSLSGARR
jgi:putative ABC transport system substrate-binding protein